jgi:hypothetical protein
MKKLVLLIVLVVACNGCGQGWRPFMRGASCGSACGAGLPAAPATHGGCCEGTYAMGYPSYGGETVIGSGGYYDGQFMGETVLGEIVRPGAATGGSTLPPAIGQPLRP